MTKGWKRNQRYCDGDGVGGQPEGHAPEDNCHGYDVSMKKNHKKRKIQSGDFLFKGKADVQEEDQIFSDLTLKINDQKIDSLDSLSKKKRKDPRDFSVTKEDDINLEDKTASGFLYEDNNEEGNVDGTSKKKKCKRRKEKLKDFSLTEEVIIKQEDKTLDRYACEGLQYQPNFDNVRIKVEPADSSMEEEETNSTPKRKQQHWDDHGVGLQPEESGTNSIRGKSSKRVSKKRRNQQADPQLEQGVVIKKENETSSEHALEDNSHDYDVFMKKKCKKRKIESGDCLYKGGVDVQEEDQILSGYNIKIEHHDVDCLESVSTRKGKDPEDYVNLEDKTASTHLYEENNREGNIDGMSKKKKRKRRKEKLKDLSLTEEVIIKCEDKTLDGYACESLQYQPNFDNVIKEGIRIKEEPADCFIDEVVPHLQGSGTFGNPVYEEAETQEIPCDITAKKEKKRMLIKKEKFQEEDIVLSSSKDVISNCPQQKQKKKHFKGDDSVNTENNDYSKSVADSPGYSNPAQLVKETKNKKKKKDKTTSLKANKSEAGGNDNSALNEDCDLTNFANQISFKFNTHSAVRDYVPRRLMKLNGLSEHLTANEVNLKIPEIIFKGSSINEIRGYGVYY